MTLVTTSGGGLTGVVMAQVLRVDFVDMKMSSNLIDEHREDLRAAHAAADAAIEAAQSGWVGQSALALQEKLLELQGVTHHADNECDHHSTAITAISDKFQKIDEQEAIEIIRTRRSI
ncbi:WXG100 family type VII secretion target [Mycobacteroides abscessus]|uniref:WXG100 family type VII secretion target n=2 Tax=Mycobacteroides abscessus TaxID=36809 RepID=UPI00187824FC